MNRRTTDRILPHSLEAEQSVLGSILLHNDALIAASAVLTPEDFFRMAHRRIYSAMLNLSERRVEIDLITLKEELTRGNLLDDVGGPAYITSLIDGMPRSSNVEHYAKIVREKAVLRTLIASASRITETAYEAEVDSASVLAEAEAVIYGLTAHEAAGELIDGAALARVGFAMLERLHATGRLAGLSTGLATVDEVTLGLHKQHLTVVAARPGRGKSAFALHLARMLGMTAHNVVAMFSLEMSNDELAMRIMSSEGGVGGHQLRSGFVSAEQQGQLGRALNRLGNSDIWVDDTPGRTVLQIRSQCRRLKAKVGLSAVIVDYLQLMTPMHKKDASREQEVANMAWGCKMLAKELDVPVILLSQLNRALEHRQNSRPQLSDLRESGAIEQHADDVLFVHPSATDHVCEIIVGKQRNGPTGIFQVGYDSSQFRFWNLAAEQA